MWKSSRNNSGLGKYWNTNHFDSVLNLEILESSLLSKTFAKESILGTCSWKKEHGNSRNNVKTDTFLKMGPQAKPLCS